MQYKVIDIALYLQGQHAQRSSTSQGQLLKASALTLTRLVRSPVDLIPESTLKIFHSHFGTYQIAGPFCLTN